MEILQAVPKDTANRFRQKALSDENERNKDMTEKQKEMEELEKYLKTLPKEFLLVVIYDLMKSGHISYADITQMHIEHLEQLKKGATEMYLKLQYKVTEMFNDHKKNMRKNLKDCMLYLRENGTINITEEQINKKL